MTRHTRVRIPLHEDDLDMPGIAGIPGITLTPEQEKIYQDYVDKQNKAREEQQRMYEMRDTEQQGEKIQYIMDVINSHPLLKEIMGLKRETPAMRYIRLVTPSVIETYPTATPEAIAKKIKDLAAALVDLEP